MKSDHSLFVKMSGAMLSEHGHAQAATNNGLRGNGILQESESDLALFDNLAGDRSVANGPNYGDKQ